MPFYLHQWIYKDTQIRNMVLNTDEHDRYKVLQQAVELFDGKMLHFFFSFGDHDGIAISEFKDNQTALACIMMVLGQGNVQTVRTTALLTAQEIKDAMGLAYTTLKGKGMEPRAVDLR